MHCGIDCSRSGTNMPDLDLFQIWNFARTDNAGFQGENDAQNWDVSIRRKLEIDLQSNKLLYCSNSCPSPFKVSHHILKLSYKP